MKKILYILLIMIIWPSIKVDAVVTNSFYSTKVTVFYEDNCKEYDEERKWLEEYQKDNYINIEYINIKNDENFYNKVKKSLNIKKKKLPLVIIGTNYFIGFNDKVKVNITNAIKSYEDTENYCDIVSKIQNGEDAKDCISQNSDIYNQQTGIPTFVKVFLVGGISVCLVIGAIIIIKKKKIK